MLGFGIQGSRASSSGLALKAEFQEHWVSRNRYLSRIMRLTDHAKAQKDTTSRYRGLNTSILIRENHGEQILYEYNIILKVMMFQG